MNKTQNIQIPLEGFTSALPLDENTILLQKDNNEVAIFDVTSQKIVNFSNAIPTHISKALLFTPQQLILGGEDCSIRIWQLDAKEPDRAMTLLNNQQCRAPICSLTKRNNDQFISTDLRGFLKIWDINSGDCLHEHKFKQTIIAVHINQEDQLTLLAANIKDFFEYQYTISSQEIKLINQFRSHGHCSELPIQQAVIESSDPKSVKIFRARETPESITAVWVEKPPAQSSSERPVEYSDLASFIAPNDSESIATVSNRGKYACFFSPKTGAISFVVDPVIKPSKGYK